MKAVVLQITFISCHDLCNLMVSLISIVLIEIIRTHSESTNVITSNNFMAFQYSNINAIEYFTKWRLNKGDKSYFEYGVVKLFYSYIFSLYFRIFIQFILYTCGGSQRVWKISSFTGLTKFPTFCYEHVTFQVLNFQTYLLIKLFLLFAESESEAGFKFWISLQNILKSYVFVSHSKKAVINRSHQISDSNSVYGNSLLIQISDHFSVSLCYKK